MRPYNKRRVRGKGEMHEVYIIKVIPLKILLAIEKLDQTQLLGKRIAWIGNLNVLGP